MNTDYEIPDYLQEEINDLLNNKPPLIVWDGDFEVPAYVLSEIEEYYKKGKPIAKWDNIVSLMNLSKVNNGLTIEQIEYLKVRFK